MSREEVREVSVGQTLRCRLVFLEEGADPKTLYDGQEGVWWGFSDPRSAYVVDRDANPIDAEITFVAPCMAADHVNVMARVDRQPGPGRRDVWFISQPVHIRPEGEVKDEREVILYEQDPR